MGQQFVAKIVDVLGPEVVVESFFLMMTEQGLYQEDRLAIPKIKCDQQLRLSLGKISVVKVVDVYHDRFGGGCSFSASADKWIHQEEAHLVYVISRFKFGDFWWMKRGGLSGLLHN